MQFTRIINGLSLTQHSLNDWWGLTAKVPSHCETLDAAAAEQLGANEQLQRAHVCAFLSISISHTDPGLYHISP